MKFKDLTLEPSLNRAVVDMKYDDCTPIQTAVIPILMAGQDVSGLAQTGTGKTAAFLIPMMERILRAREIATAPPETVAPEAAARAFPDWRALNFILVLVPTRELAEQVFENVTMLSKATGLRGVSIYGGTSYDKQKDGMKAGVEFVVATPGRLIDLYREHIVDLKQVRAVVFDEADRMFDMGFKDDMKFILQRIPKDRQVAVFSATLNFDVSQTIYQFGSHPIDIDVSRDQPKAENVKDKIFHLGDDEKPMYLLSLIKKVNPKQAIVFSNFKSSVETISDFLSQNGVPAVGISSLLTQAQRNRVLEQFKADNEKNILVATDLAARGLDIKGVDLVINVDLPNDAESYVHRIGRTGRAGAEGLAYSFVSDRDVDALTRVEEFLKHKVDVEWLDEQELVRDFKPVREERSEYRPRPSGGRAGGEGDRKRADRGPRRDGRDGRDGGGRDGGRRGGRGGGGGPDSRRREMGPRPDRSEQQRESGANREGSREGREQQPREKVVAAHGRDRDKGPGQGQRPDRQARGEQQGGGGRFAKQGSASGGGGQRRHDRPRGERGGEQQHRRGPQHGSQPQASGAGAGQRSARASGASQKAGAVQAGVVGRMKKWIKDIFKS